MILEYAQLLSTAHRVLDGVIAEGVSATGRKRKSYVLSDSREGVLYFATHINHPSAVWVRKSNENYIWLYDLWHKLMNEYTYRYGKNHASERLMGYLSALPINIPNGRFTEPTLAMPDEYKVPGDAITSYRNYYINSKSHLAKWKNRATPNWYVHDTLQTGVLA